MGLRGYWESSAVGRDLVDRRTGELTARGLVALGAASALLFVWPVPQMLEQLKASVPAPAVQTSGTPAAPAAHENDRRYALVLAACFNGQAITDGSRVFVCRERR